MIFGSEKGYHEIAMSMWSARIRPQVRCFSHHVSENPKCRIHPWGLKWDRFPARRSSGAVSKSSTPVKKVVSIQFQFLLRSIFADNPPMFCCFFHGEVGFISIFSCIHPHFCLVSVVSYIIIHPHENPWCWAMNDHFNPFYMANLRLPTAHFYCKVQPLRCMVPLRLWRPQHLFRCIGLKTDEILSKMI